jgi:hypothetical protein
VTEGRDGGDDFGERVWETLSVIACFSSIGVDSVVVD